MGNRREVLSMRSYRLISADSHVNPPPSFWRDYLPAKYRDQAPRVETSDEGDFVIFEGTRKMFGTLGGIGHKDAKDFKHVGKQSDTAAGGWDPEVRVSDLDLDSVDAEVIFGGGPLETKSAELYEASFHASKPTRRPSARRQTSSTSRSRTAEKFPGRA